MIVSLIVAQDESGGIGKAGRLPWHLGADLKNFKQRTMGHYLIIGRKTYEAIGRPLPGRKVIVITRQAGYSAPGCAVVNSFDQALNMAEAAGETEVFIGGGSHIFSQALPHAQQVYLTQVHASLDCDSFFPQLDMAEWLEIERSTHPADPHNDHPFTVLKLQRKKPKP